MRGGHHPAGERRTGSNRVARKTLLECSFLVPLRRDRDLADGKPHSKRAWRWLEHQLHQFGGATLANATFEGWYVDPAGYRKAGKRHLVEIFCRSGAIGDRFTADHAP